MANIKCRPTRLDIDSPTFETEFKLLTDITPRFDDTIEHHVKNILNDVRTNGDKALLKYTDIYDNLNSNLVSELEISQQQTADALARLPKDQATALNSAANRIRQYHEKQKEASWSYHDEDGTLLGQKITPLDKVGVYVPGGTAIYPSSVLMNVIPAKVAGVEQIVMVSPKSHFGNNDTLLAAAAIAKVDKIYTIGGAQAIAALTWGTETIPAVDKITGPGNMYVATAKRLVFGQVGIDLIAGPSEVVIIADGNTNPDWIAMDLMAQAEHDSHARAILISNNSHYLDDVESALNRLILKLDRRQTILDSIDSSGTLIKVGDLHSAALLANRLAPEHLQLAVDSYEPLLAEIKHAGAIFLGSYSSESLGDYCAGPNHVLPTSGTARFSSALGVYDFQKRSSIIDFSVTGAQRQGQVASILARSEGLTAHAESVEMRMSDIASTKDIEDFNIHPK